MKKRILIILLFGFNILLAQDENKRIYNQLIELDQLSKNKDKNIDLKLKEFSKQFNSKINDSLLGFYNMILANTLSNQLKKDEAIIAIKKSNLFYICMLHPFFKQIIQLN